MQITANYQFIRRRNIGKMKQVFERRENEIVICLFYSKMKSTSFSILRKRVACQIIIVLS